MGVDADRDRPDVTGAADLFAANYATRQRNCRDSGCGCRSSDDRSPLHTNLNMHGMTMIFRARAHCLSPWGGRPHLIFRRSHSVADFGDTGRCAQRSSEFLPSEKPEPRDMRCVDGAQPRRRGSNSRRRSGREPNYYPRARRGVLPVGRTISSQIASKLSPCRLLGELCA